MDPPPPEDSSTDNYDPIQGALDAVSRRLCRPPFLQELTPSRLPSQAASEASASPKDPGSKRASQAVEGQLECTFKSPLKASFSRSDDLTTVLTLSPNDDGSAPGIAPEVADTLNSAFLQALKALSKMAADRGFQAFSHGHNDLVLAVDFNYYGTRMVTASSDHRLKVWDRKDESWSLSDTWRGHDAEIVDVKWNGPFLGEILGSIAEDGRFKLWQEDVTEMPNSGNRFKLVCTMSSETKVPYMSLDFKNIFQEFYIAMITRDGYLTVYELVDASNMSEWNLLGNMYVCATPSRQDETGFKVCFHREKLPCWTAIMAGLDKKALSLAVAAMDVVRVYRMDKNRRFYVAAELTGARNIIRDVAWANGAMRGYDVIATASKDGSIRIYELSTPKPADSNDPAEKPTSSQTGQDQNKLSREKSSRNAPSGIGAGLAGALKPSELVSEAQEQNPGRVKHDVKLVAELSKHHGAVWRVNFSQMGDLLVSTGDDGAIRTWKKATNDIWLEYSVIDASRNQEAA